MKSRATIFISLASSLGLSNAVVAQQSDSVILFMVDGVHWQAPQKADMSNFASLIDEGTYIRNSYAVIPHHPTIGDYSEFNTCSFPNPLLHSGTVFIKPENNWTQEVKPTDRQLAFVVNTSAYRSIARGFTTAVMKATLTDRGGCAVFDQSARKKETGKWDSTVLIATSDHGQSKTRWHPMLDEDSWVTPLVFAGAGIASNQTLPYSERTDLSPSIAHLLGLEKPNDDGGSGEDAYFGVVLASPENKNLTPEPFYRQDRITEWHKAESVEGMIKANAKILGQMQRELGN